MNPIEPTYLGDAVYASFDGYHICLHLNDHRSEQIVALDPEVIAALNRYADKCRPKPEAPSGAAAEKLAELRAAAASAAKWQQEQLDKMGAVVALIPQHLHGKLTLFGGTLDLNNLTREESVEAMRALPVGKWTKGINCGDETLIDYCGTIDSVNVRLWAAAPPDSCRVVEVEEVVPATIRTVKKLICHEA